MHHLASRLLGSSRFIFHLSIVSAYLLFAVILTLPLALYLTTHIPIEHQLPGWMTGDGDPWHSLWILWFVNHSLLELGRLPFSTDMLFYPRGMDLMYFSLIALPLLLALTLVPVVGLITTYNVLVLLSLAGAGYGAFLLVHYLTRDRGAAFIAGLVFAFSPYHMAHALEHLFLLMGAVWLPLYVLYLSRALREGQRANFVLASSFFLLTMLSNPYYAVYLILFTSIYGLLQILWAGDTRTRRNRLQRCTWVVGCCVATAMPIVILASLAHWSDTRLYMPLSDANILSADLLAFFVPSVSHPLWGALVAPIYKHFDGITIEQTVYIGYVVLAVSLLAVGKGPKAKTRPWSLTAIIFFALSLGPFLHIDGAPHFTLGDTTFRLPMPYLLLHYIPIIGGIRAANRFDVMLMLSLAVLTGYGVHYLLRRLQGRWRGRVGMVLACSLAAAILCEFATVPWPILDAKIPSLYQEIGAETARKGSLVELPLDIGIAKYQYYQTVHQMKRLIGFGPRPSKALIEYGDRIPFMQVFKHPDRLEELGRFWGEGQAQRFIDMFDIDVIVIHREYLLPETAARLEQWLLETFPVRRVTEAGSLSVLWMQRNHESQSAGAPLDVQWDFNPSEFPPFLSEGWLAYEGSGELTFAWADGHESRLWVFLPSVTDLSLELGLFPFTWPGSPPQGITIYVNGQFLSEVRLEADRWYRYTIYLPRTFLTLGQNTLRFVYSYTASPAEIVPGNRDTRRLAVAFDFIALRAQ
jgi:hypothetical protein